MKFLYTLSLFTNLEIFINRLDYIFMFKESERRCEKKTPWCFFTQCCILRAWKETWTRLGTLILDFNNVTKCRNKCSTTFSILWKYEKVINKLPKAFTKINLQTTHKQVLNAPKINIKGCYTPEWHLSIRVMISLMSTHKRTLMDRGLPLTL